MAQYVRGPFGLWPFPILNFILQRIQAQKQPISSITSPTTSSAMTPSTSKGFHNLERFEIKYDPVTRDPIEITVHRKVEPNE